MSKCYPSNLTLADEQSRVLLDNCLGGWRPILEVGDGRLPLDCASRPAS